MHIVDTLIKMTNIFDYNEYLEICRSTSTFSAPERDYFCQVGIFMGAMFSYSDLSPKDAYAKVTAEPNIALEVISQAMNDQPVKTSLFDMMKSAANELTSWVKEGMPRRDGLEIDAVLEICKGCESVQELPGGLLRCDQRQGGCGCMMDIKAWMATTSCPKGKW